MKFSLILPTRDRPGLFERCIKSIWEKTTHKKDIEILVICDEDDQSSQIYVHKAKQMYSGMNIILLTRPRSELSNQDYYNWAGAQAIGEMIWIFADDLEIVKFNWDEAIWNSYQAFKKDKPDNCICANIRDNTPPPSHTLPKFPCFPMFTREARDFFGWLLHPSPPNWGADYITYRIYEPANRLLNIQDENYINHISYHNKQVKEDAIALRIGNIFNRLKMIPKYNTDRILSEEVPVLRAKLMEYAKLKTDEETRKYGRNPQQ
jgi:hypothetical protein